ncbi:MAG: NAD-binding protein [Actinobacteria bacterium]|jgi:voltage-gated potassium channel|nr:NAD-binding protein [Actinomycetota bacterium]
MARWVGASLRRRLTGALSVPLIRRVIFHVRRLRDDLDIHFFRSLVTSLAIIVTLSALLVSVAEPSKRSISGLVRSAYWAMTMVLGSGDSSYVDGPVGYLVGWALAFFGVAIVAALTAAVAGFVIDFILKEGQGMGASGYIDHIVICGWNPTARELIEELKGDEFKARVVIIHDVEHNPAGSGTYFVRGDPTSGDDLRRAGIEDAAAAVICPSDSSNDADMRSILSVLAIETIAPEVRTVVEVNNPKHVEHFERAHADEILVTPRLASRLLARSALYPGLASLVTDLVSGGQGSELYRVRVPDHLFGETPGALATLLRSNHNSSLIAVTRDGISHASPPADFMLREGDCAIVVAESLTALAPLQAEHALSGARSPVARPA